MKKIDQTVRRETLYIAALALIFSMLLQAVFLMIGKWELSVLWGNLLGGAVAVLNFFLMGLTVQLAVQKDEKDAKMMMKASQGLRTVLLFAAAALGVLAPCFQTLAALIPLFFPRVAVALRPLIIKEEELNK